MFTHSLVEGLRGEADRDGDESCALRGHRLSGAAVPERTASRQHPWVAGAFDARAPLAIAKASPTPPPGVEIPAPILRAQLETQGQACVTDYVQSTEMGLKRAMLARAVDAFTRLQALRPDDPSIEPRKLFCRGRLEIAEGRFGEAVGSLQESLKLDPRFACSYNALGVALTRLNRPQEARAAFDRAAQLTPEWALPPFQIAAQLIAAGNLKEALPYLEKAVRFNPRSVASRWNLLRAHRLLGQTTEVERQAAELIGSTPTTRQLIWNWAWLTKPPAIRPKRPKPTTPT